MTREFIRWFEDLEAEDVGLVGGKNASLGEMIRTLGDKGVRVPGGFALTADAYWEFVLVNGLREPIVRLLGELASGRQGLDLVGPAIGRLFDQARMPAELAQAVAAAYQTLSSRYGVREADVAVRSSATAEDLPQASFAGQHESYLNVRGTEALLDACRRCFASLFTERAIAYRDRQGFQHMKVALSVGVQKMVRADQAGAGVMFTIDTETGFPNIALIDAGWGLGESVVKGVVTPDEYRVFKPLLDDPALVPIIEKRLGSKRSKIVYGDGSAVRTVDTSEEERQRLVLTDDQIIQLARWGVDIERHYGQPMDIEWAIDGDTETIYVLQARPETVESRKLASALKTYALQERGTVLVRGSAVGEAIAAGKVFVLRNTREADRFEDGGILVTEMTDPDWVPLMRRASGIVTDRGGRTSHAAIVSRELGVPAIVGTGQGTSKLPLGGQVTLSCAEGSVGIVYDGRLRFTETAIDVDTVPHTRTHIMINLADPDAAFRWWRLPCHGVGLARMEFIINRIIQIHPMALVRPDAVQDQEARRRIGELTAGYPDRTAYFVDHLAQGIGMIAASRYPSPVIVRMSDFKSNEYANLIGGRGFEPHEANPMLGLRGASRYYSEEYREAFALECRALRRVREVMGFTNVVIMIPFCRTLAEADRVLQLLAANGLVRGQHGLHVYMMAEIPSNVFLAEEFAERFDGFSIGSNDLTQLLLGIDRDSVELAALFDERDETVKRAIKTLIERAHAKGITVGICGQAPSDHPGFAEFLVGLGIDSISLNPDSVIAVCERVAAAERSRETVALSTRETEALTISP